MRRGWLLLLCWGCGVPTEPQAVPPRATLTLTFDDGHEGVYQYAFPIMQQYGMVGNVAIFTEIWSVPTRWPYHLTIAQAQALNSAGWSIVSHSVTHPDLATLSLDSVRIELRESRRVLDSLQFRGTHVFVVPYLLWDEAVYAEIAKVYTVARCCTQAWWSSDTLAALPAVPGAAWYELTGVDISNYSAEYDQTYNYTTEAGRAHIQSVLEDAVQQAKFLDLILHDVTAPDSAAFRKLVEQLVPYTFTTYAHIHP